MAIAVDPQDPATVYAGTGSGVFKSTNSGVSWTALNTGLGNSYVQALAFDPAHNLYAGTASGLYKLPSGTTSWVPVPMPVNISGIQPSVSSIVANPTTGMSLATLFVGANESPDGLYVSTDGGSSWTSYAIAGVQALAMDSTGGWLYAGTSYNPTGANFQACLPSGGWQSVSCSSAGDGLNNSGVNSIVLDPSAPGTIYAAGPGGIFKTTVGGQGTSAWSLITNGMNNPYPGVNVLAIDPVTTANLYAGSAFQEGFVAAFDSSGAVTYSTPVGGDRYNHVRGIAVDGNHNSYVVGYTTSPNFPITVGNPYVGNNDVVLLKLAISGTPVYSILIGGSGDDYGYAIAADNTTVYFTGQTCSFLDFPVVNAAQGTGSACSAFVAKAQPNVSGPNLLFSTYLGGTNNDTTANGIAVDGNGNVWVAGQTWANDFPTRNASQPYYIGNSYPCSPNTCYNADAFVTQYNASGALQFSTYLGGTQADNANAVAVDPFGSAYVAGYTYSGDFPVIAPALQMSSSGPGAEMFIAKFTSSGLTDDLSVTLDNGNTSTTQTGTAVTYTATVTNISGDSLSGNNVVLVISPVGVNVQDAIPLPIDLARCQFVSLQSIRCALGAMPPGNSTQVVFTETPQQAGTLAVRAWVSSDDLDTDDPAPPSASNNRTQLSTTVNAAYGVGFQLSHSPEPVVVGYNVTETITVTNLYDPISSGSFVFEMPAGSNFVPSGSSSACTSGGTGLVNCTLPAMSQNGVVTRTVVYTAPLTPGSYTDPPIVSSISTSPSLTHSPGSPMDTVTVVAGADLAVSLSMSPPANTGPNTLTVVNGGVSQVTFTSTVTNTGPSAPTAVVLDTFLPAGLSYASASPSQGTCQVCGAGSCNLTQNPIGYTQIRCSLGALPASATVSVTANIVRQAGYVSAMANVSSEVADPNTTNNKAFARVQVLPTANSVEHWFLADRITSALYALDLNATSGSFNAPGYSRPNYWNEGQAL